MHLLDPNSKRMTFFSAYDPPEINFFKETIQTDQNIKWFVKIKQSYHIYLCRPIRSQQNSCLYILLDIFLMFTSKIMLTKCSVPIKLVSLLPMFLTHDLMQILSPKWRSIWWQFSREYGYSLLQVVCYYLS